MTLPTPALPPAPPAGPLPASEHLLVCVMADGQATALVEQARRMHLGDGSAWSVVGVEVPEIGSQADVVAMLEALDVAERQGASAHRLNVHSSSRQEVLAAIVQRARATQATALLIGRPHFHRVMWRSAAEPFTRLTDQLAKHLPGVAIHVFAKATAVPAAAPRRASATGWRSGWQLLDGWATAAAALLVCTLLSLALESVFEVGNLVMIYLAGVTYVALRKGGAAAMLSTLGGTLLFYLLFVPPRWSVVPTDPQYSFTFAVMLAVGLVISRLAAGARRQTQSAEARSQRAQALNQGALRLAQARTADAVALAVSTSVSQATGSPAKLFVLDSQGQLPPPSADLQPLWHLAETATRQRRETGTATAIEPHARARFIPLLGAPGALGDLHVLGLLAAQLPLRGEDVHEDEHLLRAFANQAALALERVIFEKRSADAAVEAAAERLRNTLLAGVSHDFRTPLTAIVGSVTSLLDQGHVLDDSRRRRLLQSVLEQAQRLHKLSSDLLDMARMEEGAVRLNAEWCPADELVAESLATLAGRVAQHRLHIVADADTIVWGDTRLLVQALVNLIDNAIRHAPGGSAIHITVQAVHSLWELQVRDEGPGIPAGLEQEVLKKFFRGPAGVDMPNDNGTGLGLAICAAVAQLHGGQIEVRPGPGACITLRLPLPQQSRSALDDEP